MDANSLIKWKPISSMKVLRSMAGKVVCGVVVCLGKNKLNWAEYKASQILRQVVHYQSDQMLD